MIREPKRCARGSTTWTRTARAFWLCTTLLALAAGSGCKTVAEAPERAGDALEAGCVKGQLSAQQAASLDPAQFKTWPSYCLGREDEDGDNGDAWCQPQENDRIFAAHCARAIRELFEGR